MRKPVVPIESDLFGSPTMKYQIPEITPEQEARVRRLCPADVLEILGMTQ